MNRTETLIIGGVHIPCHIRDDCRKDSVYIVNNRAMLRELAKRSLFRTWFPDLAFVMNEETYEDFVEVCNVKDSVVV